MLDIKSLLYAFSPFVIEEEDTTVAKNIWRGDAQAYPQITDCTFGTVTAAESFGITINGKTIKYTVTSSVSDAARLAELIAAMVSLVGQYSNDIPEFSEISAAAYPSTGTASALRLTGPKNGKPFTVSSWSGGSTVTFTEQQTPTGPNWFNNPANWSRGTAPDDTEEAIFENSEVSCLYGLEELSTIVLSKLRIKASYLGQIGLPLYSVNDYYEYRPRFLKIGATKVMIGEGEGAGSQLIKIDTGDELSTVLVADTANPASGECSVYLRNNNSNNKLFVYRGLVGIANERADDQAAFTEVNTSYRDSEDSDVTLIVGEGGTVSTLNKVGGKATMWSAPWNATNVGGELRIQDGNVSTLNVESGTAYYSGTGTVTTATVYGDGELSMAENMQPNTITNLNLHKGATYRDPHGATTITNPVNLVKCRLQQVTLETTSDVTVAIAD